MNLHELSNSINFISAALQGLSTRGICGMMNELAMWFTFTDERIENYVHFSNPNVKVLTHCINSLKIGGVHIFAQGGGLSSILGSPRKITTVFRLAITQGDEFFKMGNRMGVHVFKTTLCKMKCLKIYLLFSRNRVCQKALRNIFLLL